MGTRVINKHGRSVMVADERVESLLKQGFKLDAPDPEPLESDLSGLAAVTADEMPQMHDEVPTILDEAVAEIDARADLEDLNKSQLVDFAKDMGLELKMTMKKTEMIDAIIAN